MTAISVRVPDSLAKRLEILAAETGRSKTFYILEPSNEHIDDLEDTYIAQKRSSNFHKRTTSGTLYS